MSRGLSDSSQQISAETPLFIKTTEHISEGGREDEREGEREREEKEKKRKRKERGKRYTYAPKD